MKFVFSPDTILQVKIGKEYFTLKVVQDKPNIGRRSPCQDCFFNNFETHYHCQYVDCAKADNPFHLEILTVRS